MLLKGRKGNRIPYFTEGRHTHILLGYINRGDHRSYTEVSDFRGTLTRWSSSRKGWFKWRRIQNHVIWIRIKRTDCFPNWDKKTQSCAEGYGSSENTHSVSWKLLRDTGELVILQRTRSSKSPWTKCPLNLALNSKGFLGGSVGKESSCKAGDSGDVGSVPKLERSLGGGHGNILRYFCLEKPMDRGAWQATVHSVAQNTSVFFEHSWSD